MPRDIELPNGYVIEGVPDNVTKEQIRHKAISAGYATEEDFGPVSQAAPVEAAVEQQPRRMEDFRRPVTDDPMAELEAINRQSIQRQGMPIPGKYKEKGVDVIGGMGRDIKSIGQSLAAMGTGALTAIPAAGQGLYEWLKTGDVEEARKGLRGWQEMAYQPTDPVARGALETIAKPIESAFQATEELLGPEARIGSEIALGLLPLKGIKAGKKVISKDKAKIKELMENEVRVDIGQKSQGVMKSLQDKARSVPFLGEAIDQSTTRSLDDFSRSMGNKALAPIKHKLPKDIQPGYEMNKYIKDAYSSEYGRVLNDLTVTQDPKLHADVARVFAKVKELPKKQQSQFEMMVKDFMPEKGDVLPGQAYKQMDSQLGTEAMKLAKVTDNYAKNKLGRYIYELKDAWRDRIERISPEKVQDLKNADETFQTYQILEDASKMTGNVEGRATPAQFVSATKKADVSRKKGKFGTGQAKLQRYAEIGKEILPNRYPESGTAGRAAIVGAGGAGILGGLDPISLASGAAGLYGLGKALYSRPSVAAQKGLLRPRGRPTVGIEAPYAAAGLLQLPQYRENIQGQQQLLP